MAECGGGVGGSESSYVSQHLLLNRGSMTTPSTDSCTDDDITKVEDDNLRSRRNNNNLLVQNNSVMNDKKQQNNISKKKSDINNEILDVKPIRNISGTAFNEFNFTSEQRNHNLLYNPQNSLDFITRSNELFSEMKGLQWALFKVNSLCMSRHIFIHSSSIIVAYDETLNFIFI